MSTEVLDTPVLAAVSWEIHSVTAPPGPIRTLEGTQAPATICSGAFPSVFEGRLLHPSHARTFHPGSIRQGRWTPYRGCSGCQGNSHRRRPAALSSFRYEDRLNPRGIAELRAGEMAS